MSNIKKFAVEQTAVLHLKDANDDLMFADGDDGQADKNKPMLVTLYGPGSKQYAKAQARSNNKMVDKLKSKGKSNQTAEEKTLETAEFLTACTKSFENIDYDALAGEALYTAVYADLSIGFIAGQVNTHLNDWANFSKASATN